MNTLEVKILIMTTLAETQGTPEEKMTLAKNLFDWCMEEVKVSSADVSSFERVQ